ncbi:MAG: hypothetical protein ACI4XW_03195 [Candidatus Spyradocola sp.]
MRTFSFTYPACQSCAQRVNCDRCEALLRQRLLALPGITAAELFMAQKWLAVVSSLEEDALLDALEDLGLFLS